MPNEPFTLPALPDFVAFFFTITLPTSPSAFIEEAGALDIFGFFAGFELELPRSLASHSFWTVRYIAMVARASVT